MNEIKFDNLVIPAWILSVALIGIVLILSLSFFTGRQISWSPFGFTSGNIKISSEIEEKLEAIQKDLPKSIALTNCDYPSTSNSRQYSTGNHSYIDNSWNSIDGHLQENICPENQVIVGIKTLHNNGAEDRASAYKCCAIEFVN